MLYPKPYLGNQQMHQRWHSGSQASAVRRLCCSLSSGTMQGPWQTKRGFGRLLRLCMVMKAKGLVNAKPLQMDKDMKLGR
jgi:hypothetical protein